MNNYVRHGMDGQTYKERGRGDDLSFFEYLSPFCFLSVEFHCTFSISIKYYHILFIIIVFRLGSDKLVSCFFYRLYQGISHGM